MRIVAYLIVGPGEVDRMLEPVLKQLHWADGIAVCLNRADPKTRRMVQRHATFYVEDDREWGKEQWRIKQDFVSAVVRELRPDWCWSMDADEIFDPRFDRAMAEKMASGHDIAWYFWCMQLWNDPGHVRMDLSFPNVRFWRVVPELGIHFQATALHCGLAPIYAYRFGSQSGLWFKHYGLMKREDRLRKIARYDQYDPGAVYKGKSWYDALRNEKAASVTFEDAEAKLPEFIYRKKPLSPNRMHAASKKRDRKVFLFTNHHGKVVEAVGEKQRTQFLKRGFTERTDLNANTEKEAEVVGKEADAPSHKPACDDGLCTLDCPLKEWTEEEIQSTELVTILTDALKARGHECPRNATLDEVKEIAIERLCPLAKPKAKKADAKKAPKAKAPAKKKAKK